MLKKRNFCNKKKHVYSKIRRSLTNKKKIYFKITFVTNFSILRKSFNQLQRFLTIFNFLMHFDHIKRFYASIDAFKKKKYNVEIYHVKKNSIDIDFRKFDIQYIMFFFKIFNDSKSRY